MGEKTTVEIELQHRIDELKPIRNAVMRISDMEYGDNGDSCTVRDLDNLVDYISWLIDNHKETLKMIERRLLWHQC